MRGSRAGATRLPVQLQVLRTGRIEARRPATPARDAIIVGDCVAELANLPRGERRLRLRRPALQSSARRRIVAPRPERRRRGRRRLGQVRRLRRLRRVHPRLADRGAARDEARRDDRRHRLLSQHLPRRRDPPGPRLLDPQRHRLAQGQSDAEFPRPALHQRPRDDDLGGAQRRRQGLHVQLRRAEGRQRRFAGAFRLVPAALHRRGAAERRRTGARRTRRRSRKRCCSGC